MKIGIRRCVAVVVVAALAGVAAAADLPSSAPLFAATVSGLDDKPVAFAAYRGRPLVVNFWARWCAPCRTELPEFVKARARHKSSGVEMIGIALEDQAAPVREFAKSYKIDYPMVLAKDGGLTLMLALGNVQGGLPFTLAIDHRGKVVYAKIGPMNAADMDAAFGAAAGR